MDMRPNPDQLLKHVQAEEESAGRGRLKLFFGASPGVGKTYAMLEAARQRKKEGWDVVVGLVETHKRAETEALLSGLEILPRKEVSYKGVTLLEFDLDAALARQPRLIIVDELAHTNASGLRHAKRWQDIEELLDAGIDVYTTLNVQHWESLNDVVAQITGVVVQEKVPDTFLRRAHEMELVDLAPEDLLKRLKEGKIYQGELAGRAAENFFQPGNLIALRELALRHTAERVDAQMQAFKERHSIAGAGPIGARLLVGVSASPMSARLIRATSRLATQLRAHWIAVHVETPAFLKLKPEERARAINNMRMAEKLGAETVTLTGNDVTEELIAFAQSRNVSQIVLGKPANPRWKEWLFGSIVGEMARRCGTIDLHVISGSGADMSDRPRPVLDTPHAFEWDWISQAIAVVSVLTLLCWPLARVLDRANLIMLYLLGVVFTAYRFERRAALLTSILSVLAFDFFFVPPHLTFAVTDTQYVLTFAVMLGVGFLISTITGRLREQTEALRDRAERMRVLYKLSRDLSETPEIRQMLATAQKQIEDFYHVPILLLTSNSSGQIEVSAGDQNAFGWNENELSVARWVFDHAQIAGAGSDTLSGAQGLYLPMKGIRSTVGVLGLRPSKPNRLLEPDRLRLLETFASEIGGAIESTRLSEEIGRAEMHMERQAMNHSAAPTGTKLAGLLSVENIVILEEESNHEIIRSLLARLPIPNRKLALSAILEREKAGSTVIGLSVAIPHARLNGLDRIHVAVAIAKKNPVPIWVLFISPASDPKGHLAFLADLAKFFQNQQRPSDIADLASTQEILDYIRQAEQKSL